MKVKGEQVGIEVVVDDESGELLGLDIIVSENSEQVLEIIQEMVEDVDADVIVSDDYGAYKEAAMGLGLAHQICCSRVKRNTDELAESIGQQVKRGEAIPKGVDSSPERLREDLEALCQLVRARPENALDQLEKMYDRYKAAPTSKDNDTLSGIARVCWSRACGIAGRI